MPSTRRCKLSEYLSREQISVIHFSLTKEPHRVCLVFPDQQTSKAMMMQPVEDVEWKDSHQSGATLVQLVSSGASSLMQEQQATIVNGINNRVVIKPAANFRLRSQETRNSKPFLQPLVYHYNAASPRSHPSHPSHPSYPTLRVRRPSDP
ncbi:hypothetical protein ACJ73_07846 [Blastomyces percursus]|uniref:Uncharacterized protein n=1 Tax=Blastomyces percursus TaxID=1658174 RepID=A0A1J9PWT7_9EURO|nr:hypothetical protein ACJ73_07846 [Blastomyces percursus]